MINFSSPNFETTQLSQTLKKYKYKPKCGDILAGKCVGIENNYALIDVGLKFVAFLPKEEATVNLINHPNQAIALNELGEFVILSYNNKTQEMFVSNRQFCYFLSWERLKELDLQKMVFYGQIIRRIQGGNILNFDGFDIFLPNSHMPKYFRRKKKIGKVIQFKILRVTTYKHKIFGSCKLASLQCQSLIMQVGLTQYSTVISIKPFGLFVNLMGIKCLLHISELSYNKVENINAYYKKGDRILVKIIYCDLNNCKIAVSAKQATLF